MKICALISGGKDSLAAAYKASKEHNLVCLISIISKNPESYMFHIPNIHLVALQAEAMGLPLIEYETEGIKEEELKDLKEAIELAKKKYKIEGVVSGALRSNYQKQRIEKICAELKIKSIAPLWGESFEIYLRELLRDFEVIISGIAADGLTKDDLGKRFDMAFLERLKKLNVSLVGEGGEFETLVLNCPMFKKKLKVEQAEKKMDSEFSGHYIVRKAVLI